MPFSTPKAKQKANFEENLSEKKLIDEKIEKNLSKSWIDIMDDLEEQDKELQE